MWPTLIFPPLCSHFSAAAPLHPSLIQPLKISFPTQLAFSLSRRCLGLSSPPLSSCGHFLFRPPIKIVIQVTERTSDHFTAGKKGSKASFKRPARLNAAGAFHLLLLVCVCLLFVCIFFITLVGKDFRTVELGPHTLIYMERNSRLQGLQNEIANIFTLQGSRNIILLLRSSLKKVFFFLLISNCVIFVWLSAQSVCVCVRVYFRIAKFLRRESSPAASSQQHRRRENWGGVVSVWAWNQEPLDISKKKKPGNHWFWFVFVILAETFQWTMRKT